MTKRGASPSLHHTPPLLQRKNNRQQAQEAAVTNRNNRRAKSPPTPPQRPPPPAPGRPGRPPSPAVASHIPAAGPPLTLPGGSRGAPGRTGPAERSGARRDAQRGAGPRPPSWARHHPAGHGRAAALSIARFGGCLGRGGRRGAEKAGLSLWFCEAWGHDVCAQTIKHNKTHQAPHLLAKTVQKYATNIALKTYV